MPREAERQDVRTDQFGRVVRPGGGNLQLIHPKLQNKTHHDPSTTDHAARPPSGALSVSLARSSAIEFDTAVSVSDSLADGEPGLV